MARGELDAFGTPCVVAERPVGDVKLEGVRRDIVGRQVPVIFVMLAVTAGGDGRDELKVVIRLKAVCAEGRGGGGRGGDVAGRYCGHSGWTEGLGGAGCAVGEDHVRHLGWNGDHFGSWLAVV